MATETATQQVLNQISGTEKRLTAIEGLLKTLQGPASKAGKTPQQMIADASQGGAAIFAPDGTPMTLGRRGGPLKDKAGNHLGFGKFLKDLQVFSSKQASPSHREAAMKALDALQVKAMGVNGTEIVKTALAESSGLAGGYTVPPVFSTQLLRLAEEESIVGPMATHMPMTSLTLSVPTLNITSSHSAGQSPFLGGVNPTWTSESATRTESEPTFRQTELKAQELSMYAVASNDLLADNAVGLESLLTTLFTEAIGWTTDYAYLRGDGLGKPMGILNAPACLSVTRAGGANSTTFVFADVCNMMAQFYQGSWRAGTSAWVMSQSLFTKVMQLNMSTAAWPVFIPNNSGAQSMPANTGHGGYSAGTLFGLPVFFTEKLPQLGQDGDCMLIDFSKYLLGDRMDIQIDVSPYTYFLQNQMTWRVVWRGDGQPWLNSYITLADNVTTVSPFLKLH